MPLPPSYPGAALTGPRVPPAAGGVARALVVLLHGVGADGSDLVDLAHSWAGHLPHAAFVAPDAPFPCDLAPYGRQWFSLQDRTPAALLEGARAALPLLDACIDAHLAGHGLGPDRLALVGFSQGTMMALLAAPRREPSPAAVVGYSGALLGAGLLGRETRSRPPVLLVHGDRDDVVPIDALFLAETALLEAGFAVDAHVRPGLDHTIDEEGLALGGAFLAAAFGA